MVMLFSPLQLYTNYVSKSFYIVDNPPFPLGNLIFGIKPPMGTKKSKELAGSRGICVRSRWSTVSKFRLISMLPLNSLCALKGGENRQTVVTILSSILIASTLATSSPQVTLLNSDQFSLPER